MEQKIDQHRTNLPLKLCKSGVCISMGEARRIINIVGTKGAEKMIEKKLKEKIK